MGRQLNAHLVYGFSLDKHIEVEELPVICLTSLTVEEVAELTYGDPTDLSGTDYIEALIKTRFPTLDIDYPGTEDCEEMVIYIDRTEKSAYYESEPVAFEKPTEEEETHIKEITGLFGKEVQWLFYPSYG